jgi:hypothetical protein
MCLETLVDVALCTIDNNMYTLPVFENLSELTLSYYRRHLLCPKCLGQAFYRKQSRTGQAAFFEARPHGQQCSDLDWGAGWAQPIASHERIEVSLDPAAQSSDHTQARHAAIRLSPETLLANLMFNKNFAASEQLIAVDDNLFRVKDFFVPFAETPSNGRGEYRGYWGFVSDAGKSGEQPASLWLNSGGAQDLSIVVSGESSGGFVQRFGLDDLEMLAGAYVLVLGRLRVSQFGKKYIAVSDVSRMAISLAR